VDGGARQVAFRVLAACLAFVPAMLFGVAAVNKYYDYYQTGYPGEPADRINIMGVTTALQALVSDNLAKPAVLVMPDTEGAQHGTWSAWVSAGLRLRGRAQRPRSSSSCCCPASPNCRCSCGTAAGHGGDTRRGLLEWMTRNLTGAR
jgi:hypothetical protein